MNVAHLHPSVQVLPVGCQDSVEGEARAVWILLSLKLPPPQLLLTVLSHLQATLSF